MLMAEPAPIPGLSELVSRLSEGQANAVSVRALWKTLGPAAAAAVLLEALERIPVSARRVWLLRELHSVDGGAVRAAADAGDVCARQVVLEQNYLASGDTDLLAAALRSVWPVDPAAVAKGLRESTGLSLEALLQRLNVGGASYREASQLAKRTADLSVESRGSLGFPAMKVALLGDVTLDYVRPLLEAALLEHGVDATVRAGAFDQIEEVVLDPGSWLHNFHPDVIIVLSSTLAAPPAPAQAWPDLVARRVKLCELVAERLGADTVLTTLEALPEHTGPMGAPAWIGEYNAELRRAVPERAFVFDLASLVVEHGADRWFDLRLWSIARQPVHLNYVPSLADRLARFVRALYDPLVKLIVTDLDNTLWGDTVAEVGAESVQLGGNELGVAYLRLQEYLRDCRESGFLLAACSKNTEEAARGPFEKRREMVLRLDDFVDFQISFLPKSVMLPRIAERLNLGLRNVLFLDDEPHERAEMRERIPEVLVPEWPEDGILGVPAMLARTGWTTRLRLTPDDTQRLQMYREEAARRSTAPQYADLDEFLASLGLTARFAPLGSDNLDRVTQLVHKTNQFNLTSFRHTRRELEDLIAVPGTYATAVSVEDRYGPYGLTGVMVAVPRDSRLVVDLWLMSCRIMGKTVEYAMFDHLLRHARAAGFRVIEGVFRPTDKNAPVATLLPQLGFVPIGADAALQRYEFPVDSEPGKKNLQVTVIDEVAESRR
jgi:FkbH-like protein